MIRFCNLLTKRYCRCTFVSLLYTLSVIIRQELTELLFPQPEWSIFQSVRSILLPQSFKEYPVLTFIFNGSSFVYSHMVSGLTVAAS